MRVTKPYLLSLILLGLSALLILVIYAKQAKPNALWRSTDSNDTLELEQSADEEKYQNEVRRLLNNFMAKRTELEKAGREKNQPVIIELVESTKNELLNLMVPPAYQKLHLDLIIALNNLAKGL